MTRKPSKAEIEAVLSEVDALGLPDCAYWMLCHEKLWLDYGDLFPWLQHYGLVREVKP